MYKQIIKNKRKVWRKTYGKVFARRNSVIMAQMAVVAAVDLANIRLLMSSGLPVHLCIAQQVLSSVKSIANLSNQMRSGRVTK
jgi:hypothetical protein